VGFNSLFEIVNVDELNVKLVVEMFNFKKNVSLCLTSGEVLEAVMEARVLDRDRSRRRERHDERLVLGRELVRGRLVAEVEVSEHLVAQPDGHAEEGPHLGVVFREADGPGVLVQVPEPQRLRCLQPSEASLCSMAWR